MLAVRINRRMYRVFAFDVESHNDEETIAKKETSIWLYSFINDESKIDDEASYGYSIEQFLERLEKESRNYSHGKRQCSNLYIAVYNLSFEWSFILPVLLKSGFVWKEEITPKGEEKAYNTISNVSCSSVWEIKLHFGKGHGIIVFRDIAKLYAGGLRKVAKHFNLPTQKGDIDYKINRLHGWKVTKEEKEYCFKDTRILIDICLRMDNDGDTLFFKSLSAASYAANNMVKRGWPRSLKPMKKFRERYPHLTKEEDEFIRRGTGGGISYCTPPYQFKELSNLIHIDMHQAHPTSAYLNLFPKGKGTYFKGKPPAGKISICHIKISYIKAKLHSIISLIGMDFAFDHDLYVWNFEIPTMYKIYGSLEIKYIDGYSYERGFLPWRQFYRENYEARAKAKRRGDGLEVERRKLLNNSSYGKLLEHAHAFAFQNIVDEDGSITSIKFDRPVELDEAKFTYLPVGSCIPAYTRVRLIETALLFGWENVVYFDTDSIFVIDNKQTRKVLKAIDMEDHLGGWGLEKNVTKGQFSAPKRYKIVEDDDGRQVPVFHLAGFNGFYKRDKDGNVITDKDDKPISADYEDIDVISAKYQVQGSMKVKGGTIIIMKEKQVDVQPKYRQIYEDNVKLSSVV